LFTEWATLQRSGSFDRVGRTIVEASTTLKGVEEGMRKFIITCALAALGVLILLPDSGEAGRRRRSSGNYYSTGSSYSTVTPVSSPTASNEIKKQPIVVGKLWSHSRTNRTEYDYNWAARREWHNEEAKPWLFSDRLRIKLNLREDLAEISDQLQVKLTWNYMHRSQHVNEAWAAIQHDGDDRYVDLSGLDEGRLIKARLEIYRPAAENTAESDSEATMTPVSLAHAGGDYQRVGEVHAPYYGVTSSEENEEWRRRARIISFSFSQWYHDEAYGGRYCSYDCWSFYRKSADSELSGFTKRSISNSDVPRLSKEGQRFHGDYLIMSGHYGMALCYDEDRDHFCSIEGNYALSGPHRIQIDTHYHGLYTWHTIMSITELPKAEPQTSEVRPASMSN